MRFLPGCCHCSTTKPPTPCVTKFCVIDWGQNGAPLPGVSVTYAPQNIGPTTTQQTGNDGCVTINGLQQGSTSLTVTFGGVSQPISIPNCSTTTYAYCRMVINCTTESGASLGITDNIDQRGGYGWVLAGSTFTNEHFWPLNQKSSIPSTVTVSAAANGTLGNCQQFAVACGGTYTASLPLYHYSPKYWRYGSDPNGPTFTTGCDQGCLVAGPGPGNRGVLPVTLHVTLGYSGPAPDPLGALNGASFPVTWNGSQSSPIWDSGCLAGPGFSCNLVPKPTPTPSPSPSPSGPGQAQANATDSGGADGSASQNTNSTKSTIQGARFRMTASSWALSYYGRPDCIANERPGSAYSNFNYSYCEDIPAPSGDLAGSCCLVSPVDCMTSDSGTGIQIHVME